MSAVEEYLRSKKFHPVCFSGLHLSRVLFYESSDPTWILRLSFSKGKIFDFCRNGQTIYSGIPGNPCPIFAELVHIFWRRLHSRGFNEPLEFEVRIEFLSQYLAREVFWSQSTSKECSMSSDATEEKAEAQESDPRLSDPENALVFLGKSKEVLVVLRHDGGVSYGETYHPSPDAARFWEALASGNPHLERKKELVKEIADLQARLDRLKRAKERVATSTSTLE